MDRSLKAFLTLNLFKILSCPRILKLRIFFEITWLPICVLYYCTIILSALQTNWLLPGDWTEQVGDEQEIIELVPNIILNPGFEGGGAACAGQSLLVPVCVTQNQQQADENSNNETAVRLNNNSVVQPAQLCGAGGTGPRNV